MSKVEGLNISQVSIALTENYRAWRKAHEGHKTVKSGNYGFKSLRYVLKKEDKEIGSFLGRGSMLSSYRNDLKRKGVDVEGLQFVVQEIYKPKAKDKPIRIDSEHVFVLTTKKDKDGTKV